MDLRTYALTVSLASTIGLLLAIVPLTRGALEYRSPQLVDPKPELASLETFVLAKSKTRSAEEVYKAEHFATRYGDRLQLQLWDQNEWKAMFNDEREQHFYAVRSKAARNLVAYGLLSFLCLGLALVHVGWARRLSRHQ